MRDCITPHFIEAKFQVLITMDLCFFEAFQTHGFDALRLQQYALAVCRISYR